MEPPRADTEARSPLGQSAFVELAECVSPGSNDANDDSKIEFEEFVSMLAALESGIGRDEARVGFDSIDGDRSGSTGAASSD